MATSKLLMASFTYYRPLTCAATYPSRLVPHPLDLIEWVKTEGGFVHPSIRVSQDGSHGLGLVTSQDIPKGSQLIALPDHIPLKFGPLGGGLDGSSSVLADLASKVPEELWAMKLGLKLLQERARVGSFWWPYISNLPETYNVPIFFQGEDIKNLQYAPLLYQVNKRCRFLLDFEQVLKHVVENREPSHHPFGGQDVDASALGWAMSAVSSRAFRLHGKKLPNGTHTDVPMMLPLIDMCNHSFNPNARIVQEQDSRTSEMLILVVAETPIKENDTLQINYGNLNNDLFLLDYGFVMSPNPYDCIELRYDGALLEAASIACGISSPSFSSPAQWEQEILSQLLLDGEPANLKVTIGGEEVVEGRLLAAVRVLLTSDMETVKKQDLETLKSLSADAPLGVANEVAALRVIIALCVIALEHFPTKVMEDESILKQDISASAKLATQYRIHKKHVLIDVMRHLTRRVKLLLSKDVTTAQA